MSKTLTKPKPIVSLDNIESVPTKTLFEMLAVGLKGAADHMFQVSAIVVELERRGEDLSGLGAAMRKHLRLVASGRLLPEILVNYQNRETILNQLAAMPISEQRQILNDPTVSIVVGREPVKMKLLAIPYGAVDQLFDSGRIRSEEEQITYLQTKKTRGVKKAKPMRTLKAKADHKRGGITIGNGFASRAEIIVALSELSGTPTDIDPRDKTHETATVRVTTEEKQRLKAQEKQSGLSEWQLIRNALRALGMI